jgi:PD-(D/E)XK nuclease superfamily protein
MPSPEHESKLLDLIADLDQFHRERRFASRLNIFEAAGMQRQEIRHSNFLAFLLRPQESHGLGDAFFKRLIQKALNNSAVTPPPISALTLALADLSDALVSREWRNIDLLVESKNNNFVFIIENKVDSSEGDDQLSTYERVAKLHLQKMENLLASIRSVVVIYKLRGCGRCAARSAVSSSIETQRPSGSGHRPLYRYAQEESRARPRANRSMPEAVCPTQGCA